MIGRSDAEERKNGADMRETSSCARADYPRHPFFNYSSPDRGLGVVALVPPKNEQRKEDATAISTSCYLRTEGFDKCFAEERHAQIDCINLTKKKSQERRMHIKKAKRK